MSKQVKIVASNASRPRLGRGLSSLIGTATADLSASDKEYQHVTGLPPLAKAPIEVPAAGAPGQREVAIADISPNPYQPRRDFKQEDLRILADSITQQGILQPLIIVAAGSQASPTSYVLVAGERRLRAAKLAGLATVPCVVRQGTPQQMLEWALVENIQREDLNPLDRAKAYREYLDRFNLTQLDAAQRLGEPRATVANHLRLLDLPGETQEFVASGKLSFGHAKVLAGLAGQSQRQLELSGRAVSEDLSVRQLEELVAAGGSAPTDAAPARTPRAKAAYVKDMEDQLTAVIGTKVTIRPGRSKHGGRIVIDYYSLDDFDRIAGCLGLKLQS